MRASVLLWRGLRPCEALTARGAPARSTQPASGVPDGVLVPCAPFHHYRARGQTPPDGEFHAASKSLLPELESVRGAKRFARQSRLRWRSRLPEASACAIPFESRMLERTGHRSAYSCRETRGSG